MRQQQQSAILYTFIGLIIILGLCLFIFKDKVVGQFLNYSINSPVVNVSSSSAELNLGILNDSRVKALKNYITVFDYNNLDKSQDAILANLNKQNDVVISNPDEVATSSSTSTESFIRVRVGNTNPFLVKKAAK